MDQLSDQDSGSSVEVIAGPRIEWQQKLPFDIIWYMGKHHIAHPRDVYHLARVNRETWSALSREVYRADVRYTRELEEPEELEEPAPPMDDPESNDYYVTRRDIYSSRRYIEGPPPALHWAVAKGIATTADKAIAAAKEIWPAYIDVKDANGQSPIHLAADRGDLAMINTLISAGCFAQAVTKRTVEPCENYLGHSGIKLLTGVEILFHRTGKYVDALSIAIAQGFEDVALDALKLADWTRERSPSFDEERWGVPITPLTLAVYIGNMDIALSLLDGNSPLDRLLLVAASRPSNTAMLELLLARGANATYAAEYEDTTALFLALGVTSKANAEVLLDAGAEIHTRNAWGYVPLEICAWHDDLLPITKRLITEYETDPSSPDERVMSAIFGAISHLDVAFETFKFLVGTGAWLKGTYRRSRNETFWDIPLHRQPPHYANIIIAVIQAEHYKHEALKLVLERTRHPDVKRKFRGKAPLHYAMKYGRIDAVATLIKHGADCRSVTIGTALRFAKMCKEANVKNPIQNQLNRLCQSS